MREHPKEKSHLSAECLPLYLAALSSVNVFLIKTQALVPAADSNRHRHDVYKYQSATTHIQCLDSGNIITHQVTNSL